MIEQLEQTTQLSDPETEMEEPKEAHIYARQDGDTKDPEIIVLEASFYGTPIMSLCGKTFVPTRDPLRLPLCKTCEQAMNDIINMRLSL